MKLEDWKETIDDHVDALTDGQLNEIVESSSIPKYAWSFWEYEDQYTKGANSIEECLKEARTSPLSIVECKKVYIGRTERIDVHIGLDSSDVMDCIDEQVAQQIASDEYLSENLTDEDYDLLDSLLKEAIDKWRNTLTCLDGYYIVHDVKEYNL